MKAPNEVDNVTNSLHENSENQSTPPVFQEIPVDQTVDDTQAPREESEEALGTGNVDYELLMREDLNELKEEFPELHAIDSITMLDDPVRYGALRDLGLSPAEAYLATKKRMRADNRAHLRPTRSVARGAAPLMTEAEMNAARELFSGITDAEIRNLYKKVTK